MPTPENIRIKDIAQADERTLAIMWTDGRADAFDVVALRRQCPCAQCVDEWTRHRTLKPEAIAETVRPVRIDSVGSYGLKVQFSDGHATGIYTFKMLRELVAPQS